MVSVLKEVGKECPPKPLSFVSLGTQNPSGGVWWTFTTAEGFPDGKVLGSFRVFDTEVRCLFRPLDREEGDSDRLYGWAPEP